MIMALDHVRDYFMRQAEFDPMAAAHIDPGVFITRWITHFCAPSFVFLAGVSAGLMKARQAPGRMAERLVTRGVWLVLIECVVISTAWTFAPGGIAAFEGRIVLVLQVIWAIGAGMVVLAGAQYLGRRACFIAGALIVAGHNLLDVVWPATQMTDTHHPLWVALHAQMSLIAGPLRLVFVYPLIPWVGLMLLGFGSSNLFERPYAQRRPRLIGIGVGFLLAFIVLRVIDRYGDPRPWHPGPSIVDTVISFLNTTKYPPSLEFLLMTLGPAALVCAWAERLHGALQGVLVTFGRVPFAFYVAHLYLIHALCVLLGVLQGLPAARLCTLYQFFPSDYGLSLPAVYGVWILVLILLYPLCRWFARIKARREDWWLSYL
jgi:uncharacterized membrane protein